MSVDNRRDAAHNVHPLAGQGVNLGFGDVAALTVEIIQGIQSGEDIGSEAVLRRYQRQRKAANVLMMAGMICEIFESDFQELMA
jgi:2-polyprenyl-6-methoxyphenol hydroxylase-like FAD-dependent oxidoreductase